MHKEWEGVGFKTADRDLDKTFQAFFTKEVHFQMHTEQWGGDGNKDRGRA